MKKGTIGQRPWERFYPAEVPLNLEYPKKDAFYILEKGVELASDRPALLFFGKKITYQKLYRYVLNLASSLQKMGIKRGDKIALLLPNSPVYPISYYAILKIGAIVVQLNPMYTSRELKALIEDSGAKVVITLDLLVEKLTEALNEKLVSKVIMAKLKDFLPFPLNFLFSLKSCSQVKVDKNSASFDLIDFSELISRKDDPYEVKIDPEEDVAVFQYTGGTTGFAKAAMLTHYNLIVNTIQTKSWCHRSEEGKEVVLCVIPFFHVYGMTAALNAGIFIGATLVLVPKFEIKQVIKLIKKHKVSLIPGVPTLYVAINEFAAKHKLRLSSIKACISGGAPLPAEVAREFERITGAKVVEGYGLSEASPVTHANPLWGRRKDGSIGIPLPDTDAKIVDPETQRELSFKEVGELIVKGPQVMKGYWRRPEETKETIKDGWLYTGDMAYMDEDGYFYIVERKKDVIISGGYNVYPTEVEKVLYEHPKVKEAAVVGISHEYRGEIIKAYIVLKEGELADKDEIADFCRQRLAPYKVPKIIEFTSELPKTLLGKVLRRKLKEENL